MRVIAREVPGSYRQAFFRKSVLRISGDVRGEDTVPAVLAVEDTGDRFLVECGRRVWRGGVELLDWGDVWGLL